MIRLIIIFVVLFLVWQIFKLSPKQATLEEARTIGIQEAENHIQSPILLEDYVQARGISMERMESLIERGEIPSYRWRQYTYIENRELINTKN